MSIPTYEELMLPILKLVDQGFITPKSTKDSIYAQFSMTEDEINYLLPSKTSTTISDRINWAFTYLNNAGLIERVSRGEYKISPEGTSLVQSNPDSIDRHFLMRYEKFREFIKKSRSTSDDKVAGNQIISSTNELISNNTSKDEKSPDERLEVAVSDIEQAILFELKDTISKLTPTAFEKLVLQVMKGLDYGVRGTLQHTGGSRDGGIDGIITEDALGLNIIYLQAKHYTKGPIGRKEIQSFAGAMDGESATRGVFVTTSTFTKDAIQWAKQSPKHIKLIDGDDLVKLMFDRSIGLRTHKQYVIKRIDGDFFDDLDN